MPLSSLGLSADLIHTAADMGIAEPTPIQLLAIPPILQGLDVLASAATGTGKTAAYVLPLLQSVQNRLPGRNASGRATTVLVLVPTRELAAQVGELVRRLSAGQTVRPKVAIVFGGVSVNPQMMALRGGADWVIATPGRLLDLVSKNALRLSEVAHLVLDEADRLLDAGFADELASVLNLLPAERQTLLFSATVGPAVEALAAGLQRGPLRLHADSVASGEPLIVQRCMAVDTAKRTALLQHLIKSEGWNSALVFVATRYAAEHVAEKLYRAGVFATPFHGDMSQGARSQVLDELRAGRWDAVITTDLAARGIDIAQLPVVVNYDLPRSATDYIHRIGRTGRAGSGGLAVSFVTAATEAHFQLIEKRQLLSLPREQVAGFETTEAPIPKAAGGGGIKGRRPSKKDKLRAATAKP